MRYDGCGPPKSIGAVNDGGQNATIGSGSKMSKVFGIIRKMRNRFGSKSEAAARRGVHAGCLHSDRQLVRPDAR